MSEKVTFGQLAAKFMVAPVAIDKGLQVAVKKCAYKVRDDAVKKFGHLQPAVGPYPAWSPLADSTLKQKGIGGEGDPLIGHHKASKKKNKETKSSKGSSFPAPLRNTIEVEINDLAANIGTVDKIGKYHEYGAVGTGRSHHGTIPPRPFLRPALYENQERIKAEMELVIAAVFSKL